MGNTTISDSVFEYCTSYTSVTEEYAKELKSTSAHAASPGKAATKLFGHHEVSIVGPAVPRARGPATAEQLERAYRCGRWGEEKGAAKPSELFLRMWHDALCTLDKDPLVGCCSPSLMGSCGTVPLTIIAPLPDICRHMSNLIVRAETEVFLATNYWANSDASAIIVNAIRELSRRAAARNKKIVMKIIYDRGHLKQLVDNHAAVNVSEYTGEKIGLPPPDEIPGIDLQVINFHRPVFGTFHCKYMVVDRRIAIVQSNNIQDNDNLEMMSHVEGPIVDSFYDLAHISWDKPMEPPLPQLNSPARDAPIPCLEEAAFKRLMEVTEKLKDIGAFGATGEVKPPEHTIDDQQYDDDIAGEVARMQAAWSPTDTESRVEVVSRHLNRATHIDTKPSAPESAEGQEMMPYIPTPVRTLFPIAMVNRKPFGMPNHSCVDTPQNEAWLSGLRNATSEVFIQSPDLNAKDLLPDIVAAVKRGIKVVYQVCLGYNDSGELLPRQGGTNEMVANELYSQLDEKERHNLVVRYYVGKDQDKPISNKFKKRSCHVKLMVVDRQVGVQGNGNQDTQSWYHSQETNIMIDSKEVCTAWLEGIDRNQNTHIYGNASQEDGIWRDAEGNEAEGATGKDPGKFAWAKGFKGAIERVRGVGGF